MSLDTEKVESLSANKIEPIINLNLIFNIILIFLLLCIYFYAFDYVRISLTNDWKIFRYLRIIGNFFFAFSLFVLPFSALVYFVMYLLTIIQKIPISDINILINLTTGFSAIMISIMSFIFSKRMISRQTNEAVKEIQNTEEDVMNKAVELFKNEFYASSLLEMGKLIEIALQKKLLKEKNIQVQKISFWKLLELAVKYKVIDSSLIAPIKEI